MFGDLFLEMLAFCGCVILAGIIIGAVLLITVFVGLFIKGVISGFFNRDNKNDSRK